MTASAGDMPDEAAEAQQISVRRAGAYGCGIACAIVAAAALFVIVVGVGALWWSDRSAKDAYHAAPARFEMLIGRELPPGSSKDAVLAFLDRQKLLVTGDYDSVREITAVQDFTPLLGTCRVELDFGFDENWTLTGHAVRVHACVYPWSSVI